MTELTLIDRPVLDVLLASFDGDMDFFAELLDDFFEDSPVQIAAMQVAAATGDAKTLRRAAHSLKSNSATFGAMGLSVRCKELEMMGENGIFAGATEKIALIAQEYEQVRAALEAIQNGG